jgi:hypothetical protein
VDVFAFESFAASALGVWSEIGKNTARRWHAHFLAARALELSTGAFLPEDELSLVNSVRERIRSVTSQLYVAKKGDL